MPWPSHVSSWTSLGPGQHSSFGKLIALGDYQGCALLLCIPAVGPGGRDHPDSPMPAISITLLYSTAALVPRCAESEPLVSEEPTSTVNHLSLRGFLEVKSGRQC